MGRIADAYRAYAAEAADPGEVRVRKLIGVAVIVSAGLTFLSYGLVYWAYGERSAATTAAVGVPICLAILASYGWQRRYALHWFVFTAAGLALLTTIHLQLGGLRSSGTVIIWLLAFPLLTMVADTPRRGLGWAIVSASLIIGAALVDHRLPGRNAIPADVLTVLHAVNLVGFASYMLLAVFYYVWRLHVIGQQLELEREARLRSIEEASRNKSDFLASMSHELRTPLNAILGFSEVLSERMFGELNDKQAEYVRDIHSSGQHLLALVNDVLDISKVEAGRMELDITDFDLSDSIEHALLLVRERAQRHGIGVHFDAEPPSLSISGDERKIRQIALNLLSNAVKFTPEGGRITVMVRAGPDQATFTVADTGPGIAPEDAAAVFEEFRQVGSDPLRRAEGTGLGLPLAKRFAELHGGTITLRSERGQGSAFSVTLPVRAAG